MLRYLLNVIYALLLIALSPLILYRSWKTGKYRQGWHQKLWGYVPVRHGNHDCIWFHAVSVGEVLQIEPVIKQWRNTYPDWKIVISTTTETGYQVAREQYPQCMIIFFPLDFTWAVKSTMRKLRPTVIMLVELELWPNLILQAEREQIPIGLINGRLSEKSFHGYLKLKWLFGYLLKKFSLIAVQNQDYANRFTQLGVDPAHVHTVGSIKFDRLQTNRHAPTVEKLRQHFGITQNQRVLMAGSTHAPEESIVISCWEKLREKYPDLQLIIAPRHAERFDEVAKLIESRRHAVIRRSNKKSAKSSEPHIYLLDTLGELSHCWGLAELAYVGGSLNHRGGQNMMEPSAYGAAVLFGPNTWNFAEVVEDLTHANACQIIQNELDLTLSLEALLSDQERRIEMGNRAQKYVMSRQGAVVRTIELLSDLIPDHQTDQPHSRAA